MNHALPVEPDIRYARSGGVAIAYQVVGSGDHDLFFVPDYCSNLVYAWESPPGGRSTSGSRTLAASGSLPQPFSPVVTLQGVHACPVLPGVDQDPGGIDQGLTAVLLTGQVVGNGLALGLGGEAAQRR